MLEKLDMKKKMSKGDYNDVMDVLGERLGQVQRMAREAKKPIIIVFEGWRGARRSAIINTMMQQMDARGFDVYSTVRMTEEEHKQPFFTFFWQHLPALGNIAVYHRSWYYLKTANEVACKEGNASCCQFISYDHINTFEKMLTDDNYIILKYFLHLSKDQQKENIAKNAADDRRSAEIEIITSIVETVEKAINTPVTAPAAVIRPNTKYDVLGKINATQELSKEEYKKELDKYQKRLKQLQIEMFKAQIPTVICFEGWDAAGKGGAIRRLTAALDPLGFSVHPVSAPNVVERQFHYLWRFWVHLPEAGNIAIFDRTWYGRVMVERIEGFAKDYEWQRAYDEIKDMEQQWAEHGFAIAKFWLQIDKDEQLRRFTDRQNDPMKQWKITDEDWRNRDKWDAYEEAVNEMLVRTDTSFAPWTVVEGNNKYYARLKVLKTIVELFEKKLGK